MKNSLKFFVMVLALIGIAQFVPVTQGTTNPPVTGSPKWENQETKVLFDRACAACHSNHTEWPWYSKIAPISWFVQKHVEKGRARFNVDTWGVQTKNKGEHAAMAIEKGKMPLSSFLIMHPEAKLTEEEKAILADGLEMTVGESAMLMAEDEEDDEDVTVLPEVVVTPSVENNTTMTTDTNTTETK